MEHSENTKRIWAFCPKARNIYKTLGVGIILALMSFILPEKNETINTLVADLRIWKAKVVKLEQIIFRKDLIIQRKDKEIARAKIKADNPKHEIVAPKIQYVKKQLTYSDSLAIARVLSDTIYAEIIEKARRKVGDIQVKGAGK